MLDEKESSPPQAVNHVVGVVAHLVDFPYGMEQNVRLCLMRYAVSSITLGVQCGVLCAVANKDLSPVLNANLVLYAGSV
jgi:hypothetical protein